MEENHVESYSECASYNASKLYREIRPALTRAAVGVTQRLRLEPICAHLAVNVLDRYVEKRSTSIPHELVDWRIIYASSLLISGILMSLNSF